MTGKYDSSDQQPALRRLRHDLRTPVNQIIGYAELLAEGLDQPTDNEARRTMIRAVDTARSITGSVDNIVRLMTETRIAAKEIVDLLLEIENLEHAARAQTTFERSSELTEVADMLKTASRELVDRLRQVVGILERDGQQESIGVLELSNLTAALPAAAVKSEQAHILIVDDNEINRDLLTRHLSRSGHIVQSAVHGRDGLSKMAETRYDLVLLDIMMPDMDGFEVLDAMKSNDQLSSIPVVVLTSLDEIEAATSCLQMGADDFMSKPFDIAVLQARISAVLSRRGTISGASTPHEMEVPNGESNAVSLLSEREKEVLALVAAGQSNADIAEALVLSRFTVIRHVSNIYEKIEARNRADATSFAHRHGLANWSSN